MKVLADVRGVESGKGDLHEGVCIVGEEDPTEAPGGEQVSVDRDGFAVEISGEVLGFFPEAVGGVTAGLGTLALRGCGTGCGWKGSSPRDRVSCPCT